MLVEEFTVLYPPRNYHNIGVRIGVEKHSEGVLRRARANALDWLDNVKKFGSIMVDDLVGKGEGSDVMVVANLQNIQIVTTYDHKWETGGVGGSNLGATVRHREIRYTMGYDLHVKIIILGGEELLRPEGQPVDEVPEDTDW